VIRFVRKLTRAAIVGGVPQPGVNGGPPPAMAGPQIGPAIGDLFAQVFPGIQGLFGGAGGF